MKTQGLIKGNSKLTVFPSVFCYLLAYTHTHTHTHTFTSMYLLSIWWLKWQRIRLQCGRLRFNLWVGKIPWRREWQPTSCLDNLHGQRTLAGYSPWGHEELERTESLTLSLYTFTIYHLSQSIRFFSKCVYLWFERQVFRISSHTHTHTHTHIYEMSTNY